MSRSVAILARRALLGFSLVLIAYAAAVVLLLNGDAVAVAKKEVVQHFASSGQSLQNLPKVSVRWWLPWQIYSLGSSGSARCVVCANRAGNVTECFEVRLHKTDGVWACPNFCV